MSTIDSAINEPEKSETHVLPNNTRTRMPPLPFFKLLEGVQVKSPSPPGTHETGQIENSKFIDSIQILLKYLDDEKTIGSLLRSKNETEEHRKEIAHAAATLLFMGFETVYISNKAALSARLASAKNS